MTVNILKIQGFRANDLNNNVGKQFELGKTWCDDFFEFDPTQQEVVVNLTFKAIQDEYAGYNDFNIELRLGDVAVRGDRKAYANTPNGMSQIKDFFINILGLTEERNLHDYFAIYKVSNLEYYLFYIPSRLYDYFLKYFERALAPATVRPQNLLPNEYDDTDLTPIILYGPPGTGKTFKMQEEYIEKFNCNNRFITTFHQSFSYEEFVEGLKPKTDNGNIKYGIEKGIFREACERAAQLAGYSSLEQCIGDTFQNRKTKFEDAISKKRIVLLCIDEINRGNVASIFGDLISLIEDSKRLGKDEKTEMTVTLPYSKEKFGVPANLLIVGTMNTADRSIQLLDAALRRRFKFEELLPDYDKLKDTLKDDIKNDAISILQNINSRIKSILGKDYQIGHTYFIKAQSKKDIFKAIYNKVIPLLEEYFYNDIDKIRFVLNEIKSNDKNLFYITDTEATEAYEKYKKNNVNAEDKEFYVLDKKIAEDKYEIYLKHLQKDKKNELGGVNGEGEGGEGEGGENGEGAIE